jgi:hypothetical protein
VAVTVLLIDTANVLGSRPDGWWRDRAGATARLLARLGVLAGTTVPGPDGHPVVCSGVLAVLEGGARGAPAPAGSPGLRLLLAEGSGDDALVTAARQEVAAGEELLVVTADRGLRARLPAGVAVTGPGWLLERLA